MSKSQNIADGRIHVAGFGPNRPIASNSTAAEKKQNRRVEFLILSQPASLPPKESSLSTEQEPVLVEEPAEEPEEATPEAPETTETTEETEEK